MALHSKEFAADPHAFYRRARERHGALAPIELAPDVPATLVLGDRTARRILDDPTHFPADPRTWQQRVPSGLPVLAQLEWRPDASHSTGAEHQRFREVVDDALGAVDLHALRFTTERIALPLINEFCAEGAADMIRQYTLPLVIGVLNETTGCPPELGARLLAAITAIFDGRGTDGTRAELHTALDELIDLKWSVPGSDLTTRLVSHDADLSDEEIVQQLLTYYRMGIEPAHNLIANTLLLMLTDNRFTADQTGFAPPTREALHEVLTTDPPLANACATYPPLPILIDGVPLPADQPVLIGLTACSTDPEAESGPRPTVENTLAWGAGAHSCPAHARAISLVIAQDAIDLLFDALPELWLGVPPELLVWRASPFHRGLDSLPVEFTPTAALAPPAGY